MKKKQEIVQVLHSIRIDGKRAYIWICKQHGCASNNSFSCPCLKGKPAYEYDDEAFEESPSVALIAAGLLLVLGAAMGGFRRED